ncbi:hypothetical protein SK128_006463, partial [Halocaridina rubra]
MYSRGFFPITTKPTRVTENSASLIDHIWTTNLEVNITGASPNPPLWCPTTAVPAGKQLKLSVLDGNRSYDLVNAKPARYHCSIEFLFAKLP